MQKIDIEIDKLTNSIVNRISGDVFETDVLPFTNEDLKNFSKENWVFNWQKEYSLKDRQTYKLVIRGNQKVIQGLISLTIKSDHIYVLLVENVSYNKGKQKIYEGVAGNLFAFACNLSFTKGFDGFVAFEAKTKLINHYQEMLGASVLGGTRMMINSYHAQKLIHRYFNK